MIVFVVYVVNVGGEWVLRGAFDTEEKAEAFRKHLEDEGHDAVTKVEEWEVK